MLVTPWPPPRPFAGEAITHRRSWRALAYPLAFPAVFGFIAVVQGFAWVLIVYAALAAAVVAIHLRTWVRLDSDGIEIRGLRASRFEWDVVRRFERAEGVGPHVARVRLDDGKVRGLPAPSDTWWGASPDAIAQLEAYRVGVMRGRDTPSPPSRRTASSPTD